MTTESSADEELVFSKTDRNRIRREPHRGSYLHSDVYSVVDASPFCHVGYVIDRQPFVTPTIHWRMGNRLYWHGSIGSRFLRQVEGARICVTCSLVDGYVLARSAFNHTVNYRSAMMFGVAHIVEGLQEKEHALRDFMDNLFPERWDSLRPVQEKELKATSVLWMNIEEASVKSRTGDPSDADEAHIPVWAGVIPMETALVESRAAPEVPDCIELPGPLADLIASGRLR
ncbi:pyridoxamine 5'-phosphate oxidase family protein [Dyella mobilis]|uniref:Pyridoxamine 5'-phosphate oxidase family protein n=1 Tax=Dyella mobilis TaxID=1849582 RepID=A0ABS2KJZ4_9GAMM|nr:pyridoxamine 5'-phosphate oxidase family protein [Dyella mobilis]MBM7131490.1 pyridoxamine 5'-phosphate oxidase family protein [Dyella mobilis]GLQ96538.1 flavin-nucleotide-binding protein [Dyella mobilis]